MRSLAFLPTALLLAALLHAPLLIGGCAAREQPPPLPTPPALKLVPRLPELKALAASIPLPPAEQMTQLLDLGRTAFEPGAADARLAAQSRQALLAEPGAAHALEQLLVHDDAAVRSQAAFALGELGAPASVIALALRMKYEKDPVVLVWIGDALARLRNGCGLPAITDAMGHDATAQLAGTQAIAISSRAGRPVAEQPSYAELQVALRDLHAQWLARGVLPPDSEPVTDPGLTARVAQRLVLLTEFQLRPVDDTRFILARTGRAGLPLLRLVVTAAEPHLRAHALEVLRELGPAASSAIDDVLPLLHDPLTRADAVRTLGALRADAAAAFLRPWLTHPDLELRTAVAAALGPIGDHGAEPLLHACMQDAAESMDVRVAAAFSLAILERDRPGARFLRARLEANDYHAPTVHELLERAEAWR